MFRYFTIYRLISLIKANATILLVCWGLFFFPAGFALKEFHSANKNFQRSSHSL